MPTSRTRRTPSCSSGKARRRTRSTSDIETEPPEEGTVSLVGRISSIHLPLGGAFLEPAELLVSEGDEVEYEQKIAEPADEGLSVGVWASAAGEISSIEDDIVAIAGGAVSQEQAEAEAEATRPVEPEEEAEAKAAQ